MIVRFAIVIFLATFDALIIKIERGIGSTADAPLFYLCRPLLKPLAADAPGPYLKLLRKKLQDGKLIIQPVQFPLQHALIVTLLFLQRLHLEHSAVHDRGTLAAALNEVVALFLIGRDLLFHCQIEFLRHLIPLLGVINDIEAVDHQRRLLFV